MNNKKQTKTNNKTIRLAIIATFIIIILSSIAISTLYQIPLAHGSRIKISLLNQDPDPASPGNYIELRWTVENLGSSASDDVYIEIVPDYPFSLRPTDDKITNIGSLNGRQLGEEAYTFYRKLKIDENAVEGDNTIRLRYRVGKEGVWVEPDKFTARVRSIDAALSIESVSVSPSKFIPGRPSKVTFKIKNLADSTMKDITFKLDLTLSTIVAGSTTADLISAYEKIPFVPVNSATEKNIKLLKPQETATLDYTLIAFPNAESGVYKIPITLKYRDELSTEYTKNDLIGLTIGSEPEVYVVIEDSDLIAGNKNGKITLKIVNKGVTDLKFADLVLEETAEYKILSNSEEYIGNIDSDDYENVDFQLLLTNNNNKKQKSVLLLPIQLTFKDAHNRDYKKELKLKYDIYTAEQRGQEKSKSVIIIVIVVAIMIIAWVIYKKWEKKRKSKKR